MRLVDCALINGCVRKQPEQIVNSMDWTDVVGLRAAQQYINMEATVKSRNIRLNGYSFRATIFTFDLKIETCFFYVTDEFLAAVIGDLFIAGSETTTTALRWSLALLAIHPDIQERMFQEINDTIGTEKLPSVHDRTKLKYVEAFYMEVLR